MTTTYDLNNLDDIPADTYLAERNGTTINILQISVNNINFVDFEYEGELICYPLGEPNSAPVEIDAQTVAREIDENTLRVLDEQLINDPERILMSFVEHELGNYLQQLSPNHDYNGISGVDVIEDIQIAKMLVNSL